MGLNKSHNDNHKVDVSTSRGRHMTMTMQAHPPSPLNLCALLSLINGTEAKESQSPWANTSDTPRVMSVHPSKISFIAFLATSSLLAEGSIGRAWAGDERRQEMNSCERQGWIASVCINCPLPAFSPISSPHCKFSSKFRGEKILTWQRQQWAGKPICRGAKITNNNNAKFRCKAPNVGQGEFEEKVLKSDVPVLVDFVADWCGPCKLVAPFIDWASQEYKDKLRVFKVDHDSNPQLVEKYKVYGLPTLILFKDGQEVSGSRREGAITKEKLKVYLDRLLESVTAI